MQLNEYNVLHDLSKAVRQAIPAGVGLLIGLSGFIATHPEADAITIGGTGITVMAVATFVYRLVKNLKFVDHSELPR